VIQCSFTLHTSVTNRLMKSFAICFICRNILCVLTSYKTCQGKQIKLHGEQLGLTVTPVFLTCSGQLFHRAELIKTPTARVRSSNNHLCSLALLPKGSLSASVRQRLPVQNAVMVAGREKTAASKPAAPSSARSVRSDLLCSSPRSVLSHCK